MTYNEALAQLKCGIRFKVAGAIVHSVDIPYYNSDGTPAADNIDWVPYSATFQHGGHTITIRVAHEGSSVGAANPRRYTVTADAPFWCSYTCMLGHGIITTSQTYPYDYGIIYDARVSPKHRTFGDDTSDYNLAADINQLYETKEQGSIFEGIYIADIDFWTYKPLRERTNGILLRDPTTGKILVDC